MIVTCEECSYVYDDAVCWTICPHGPLGGGNRYCREHDLDPCPFCVPGAKNPLVTDADGAAGERNRTGDGTERIPPITP